MARRVLFKTGTSNLSTNPLPGYKFVGYQGTDFSEKDENGLITPIGGSGSSTINLPVSVDGNTTEPIVSAYIISTSGDFIDSTTENIISTLDCWSLDLTGITFSALKSISGEVLINESDLLQSIDMPLLEYGNLFLIENNPSLTSINLPIFKSANSFELSNCDSMTSLDLSSIESSRIFVNGCASITSVNLSSLVKSKQIIINNNPLISSINLNSLSLVGQLTISSPSLTSLQLPLLTKANSVGIGSSPLINTIDLSSLQSGSIQIQGTIITSLNLNSLVSSTGLQISNNSLLSSLQIDSLTTVETISIGNNSSLTSIDLGSITSVLVNTTLNISSNTSLTSIGATTSTAVVGLFSQPWTTSLVFYFNDNNFSQTEVDNILVAADTSGLTSSIIYVDNYSFIGTNATPSGTGNAAKTSLEGKGWTVYVA